MKRLIIYLAIFFTLFYIPQIAFGQPTKILTTRYTTVHYENEKDINEFIWHIGGGKFEFTEDTRLASSRVDRIVNRVAAILDMRPRHLNIHIYLHRGLLQDGKIALYDNKTGAVHISVENASDGVLGHELGHAIVNLYFVPPPPSKIQEILTQYVDKYLWSDY